MHACMGWRSCVSPTKAEAKSVKPMARGAMLPWPGLVTAVAKTTCSQSDTLSQPPSSNGRVEGDNKARPRDWIQTHNIKDVA